MPSSTQIDRRTLIKILARGGLALSLTAGAAQQVWGAIAAAGDPAPRSLSPAQSEMIARIADAILPRTDTPGATDVGVVPWIDLVLAQYFSAARRSEFLQDLAAIDEFAVSSAGAPMVRLKEPAFSQLMASLDTATGSLDLAPAQRGYVHLKELVIHGYFTSKPVQQEILKVVIVPGRYDPNVLIGGQGVI